MLSLSLNTTLITQRHNRRTYASLWHVNCWVVHRGNHDRFLLHLCCSPTRQQVARVEIAEQLLEHLSRPFGISKKRGSNNKERGSQRIPSRDSEPSRVMGSRKGATNEASEQKEDQESTAQPLTNWTAASQRHWENTPATTRSLRSHLDRRAVLYALRPYPGIAGMDAWIWSDT